MASPTAPNFDVMASQMSALAYAGRLELLNVLKTPHLASEIRLVARRVRAGETPDRPAAKTTVQAHLDKLVEAEFLQVDDVGLGGRPAFRYATDLHRLYALVEDLRTLCTVMAAGAKTGDETGTLAPQAPRTPARGPRLSLVHGVYEGQAFPLDGRGPWVIGRGKGKHVALDYDGFVSASHARIELKDGNYTIMDLGSKNGTHVEWVPMGKNGTTVLGPGSVIGVGRSLLVFSPR